MIQRVVIYARLTGTQQELVHSLRQTVEGRGDTVVATYLDDAGITGRGKHAGWRSMMSGLDAVDQVVLHNAGDIPGWTVAALVEFLSVLRSHDVTLYLHQEGIDIDGAGFALLDIIDAYRRAKLSQAIRNGQARAVAAGKRIGRPIVPHRIQARVRDALAQGGGIRSTARKFNVSPASVINIRRSTKAAQCTSC